jgi:energy-coupling factor transport system ATP-binding protein
MIELEISRFGYLPEKPVIRDVSLLAKAGDIVAVRGKSGSGKTTLLNIICGVIPKMISGELTGKILLDNNPISNLPLPQTAPHISMLMQEPDNQIFFPTVEQELAFGPENLKLVPPEINRRITSVLDLLKISHLRFDLTNVLSFGQKKLVALASILTLSPRILLLDEVSAGLSDFHLTNVRQLIDRMAAEGKTIILADHNETMCDLADKQILLAD